MAWAIGSPTLGRRKTSRTAPTPKAMRPKTNQTATAVRQIVVLALARDAGLGVPPGPLLYGANPPPMIG
jgi:hypothetical protein